jgi:DNA repair exonuclease SbcCD ATPase subunit
MTTSGIFNPKDSTNINSTSYFQFQQFRSDSYQQAGIFPLPRMVSWWPDEKLMAKNARLEEKNRQLNTENYKLKAIQRGTDGSQTLPVTSQNDSLRLLILQLAGKQKQIDELLDGMRNDGDKLQQQLSEQLNDCIKEKHIFQDNLDECNSQLRLLKEQLSACREQLAMQKDQAECINQVKLLTRQLNACTNEKAALQENVNELKVRARDMMQRIKELESLAGSDNATLVELFRQICAKNNMPVRVRTSVPNRLPDDNLLRNEDFYKAVDWPAFCKNFNTWYVRMSK